MLCVVPSFAADNAIKVTGIPYAFQVTTSSADGVDDVVSNYGLGAEVTYQRSIGKGFYLEAGVGNSCLFLEDDRPVFVDVLAFTGAGYSRSLGGKFSLDAHADLGADVLFYDGECSTNFTLKAGAGLLYSLRDDLDLAFGLEGTVGLAEESDADYVNYRIYPVVGVSYEF